jgi:hypothetical protein
LKEFLVAFVTIFLASVLYERITSFIGLDYRLFQDEFNLWLLLADLGIFVGLFVPIYSVLKKLVVRQRQR